jgi:H+/Cl- antiporter ClcA
VPEDRSTRPATPHFRWKHALDLSTGLRWIGISALIGALAGTASAFLLVSLEFATTTREAHRWLIALLPVAGFLVGLVYRHYGSKVEGGNALILEEIHDPQETISLRMTPLILLGTFLTHLFGGSAGREGTALQTGASLADQLTRPLGLDGPQRRLLLMAGLSAGFGSVFGTPIAGFVFGMEVLGFGRLLTPALGPCLLAAVIGDIVTRAWRVHHTIYRVDTLAGFNPKTVLASVIAGALFGLMAMTFAYCVHYLSSWSKKLVRFGPLRPAIGGVIIASAVFAMGTTRYLGLGVPVIVDSFHHVLPKADFAWKTLYTVVTLGLGFKGGEVTPLFFIGATMGNALSALLPLPASLLAGMGFVAVFAGAAKTPIASTIMAFELFGPVPGCFAAIACVASYLCSGKLGIYPARKKI